MKFQHRDKIDSLLVKVMVHEFFRCQLAFEQFIHLKSITYLSNDHKSRKNSMLVYNAYSMFIVHLYEFYKACVIRDRLDTSNIKPDLLDEILNNEVNKILRNWRVLIDNNLAPPWANHRSYYEDSCPESFGKDFRSIRNSLAHVDYRRIQGDGRIKLSEFYKKHHKYITLLYYQGQELWEIRDYDNMDLGDVSDFNRLTNRT